MVEQESKTKEGPRHTIVLLVKAEKQWWPRLLKAAGKSPPFLKVDWDKWVDEDEEHSAGQCECIRLADTTHLARWLPKQLILLFCCGGEFCPASLPFKKESMFSLCLCCGCHSSTMSSSRESFWPRLKKGACLTSQLLVGLFFLCCFCCAFCGMQLTLILCASSR